MAEKVKLAIVGCGGIASAHLNGYEALLARGCDAFEIAAVCDVAEAATEAFAERIEGFQGSRPATYTDLDAMLAAGCAQAADVCTPHWLHHSTAIPCLEAGLDAMVEKPIGITVKATRKIIEAAEKNDRIVATAENIRRYITARSIEWAINGAKMIGDVRMLFVLDVGLSPFPVDNPPMKWRAIKLLGGGGMIMDSGAHFADMMVHVFGDVEEVTCQMRTFDAPFVEAPIVGRAQLDVEDTWVATLLFKSGVIGAWAWSRSAPGHTVRQGVYYGSKGSLADKGGLFHPFQGGAELQLADGATKSREQIQIEYLLSLSPEEKDRLFPYGLTDGFAVECWDFVDAVASRRKPEMDGWDGLRSKALSEAAFEAGATGKPVKVQDVVDGKVDTFQKPEE